MLEKVMDRLEGINRDDLNDELLKLVLAAENLGLECHRYIYENGTRDELQKTYDSWQSVIDAFYERNVK